MSIQPNILPEKMPLTPDPSWVGFFTEARRLAALAQERREMKTSTQAEQKQEDEETPTLHRKLQLQAPKKKSARTPSHKNVRR